ncbi:regulatory TetR family protein [Actinokineospora auranticolor]|uniref:Regulatory TetR family protein n=2 Tax=Actinokineospora auranticolor TaxID=155976 RepID=A0A2S6GZJ0_9PSEU|nr:regulatory TetR family protein [Actinokineospora auranticolor]
MGYRRATVDEVCTIAGVTKGALYGCFASKRDLALAVLDHEERALMTARAALHGRHRAPLQVLVDLVHVHARQQVTAKLLFQMPGYQTRARSQTRRWTRAVHDLLQEAQYRGELRAAVDLNRAAGAIVTALVGVERMGLALTTEDEPAVGVTRALRTWLTALARPEALLRLRWGPPRDIGRT